MNQQRITKYLEEIYTKEDFGLLYDFIQKLKNPPKPAPREYGLIIARHIGMEEFFTGAGWSRKLQEARVYQETGPLHYGEQVYRVVRNKNGKIRRIFQ